MRKPRLLVAKIKKITTKNLQKKSGGGGSPGFETGLTPKLEFPPTCVAFEPNFQKHKMPIVQTSSFLLPFSPPHPSTPSLFSPPFLFSLILCSHLGILESYFLGGERAAEECGLFGQTYTRWELRRPLDACSLGFCFRSQVDAVSG